MKSPEQTNERPQKKEDQAFLDLLSHEPELKRKYVLLKQEYKIRFEDEDRKNLINAQGGSVGGAISPEAYQVMEKKVLKQIATSINRTRDSIDGKTKEKLKKARKLPKAERRKRILESIGTTKDRIEEYEALIKDNKLSIGVEGVRSEFVRCMGALSELGVEQSVIAGYEQRYVDIFRAKKDMLIEKAKALGADIDSIESNSEEEELSKKEDSWMKSMMERHGVNDEQLENSIVQEKEKWRKDGVKLLRDINNSKTEKLESLRGHILSILERVEENPEEIMDDKSREILDRLNELEKEAIAQEFIDSFRSNKVEVLEQARTLVEDRLAGLDQANEQEEASGEEDVEFEIVDKEEDLDEEQREGAALQIADEFERLDEMDKKMVIKSLSEFGFATGQLKGYLMSGFMNKMAELSSGNRHLNSYFKEYSASYEKERQTAVQNRINEREGKASTRSKWGGRLQGFGNVMRLGRVAFDAFRGTVPSVTMLAMFASKSSEVAKESVLKGERIKNKTRIEHMDLAIDEAYRIFGAEDGFWNTRNMEASEIQKTYEKDIPQKLRDDLKMNWESSNSIISHIMNKHAGLYQKAMSFEVSRIEKKNISDEEKQRRLDEVMNSYSKIFGDLDKMVDHYGQVDGLAYGYLLAEKGGKTLANLMIANSIYKISTAVYNMNLFEKALSLKDIDMKKFSNEVQKIVGGDHEKGSVDKEAGKVPDQTDSQSQEAKSDVTRQREEIKPGRASGQADQHQEGSERQRERKNNPTGTRTEKATQEVDGIDRLDQDRAKTEEGVHKTIERSDINKEYTKEGFENSQTYIDKEKQMILGTIQARAGSNSIEGVFIKQLSAFPEDFGFDGDPADEAAVKAWAGREAHRIAIDNGYFNPDSGQGIRLKGSSIDHNAYVLKIIDGQIGVDEYVDGAIRESHMPKDVFEAGSNEDNEYVHNNRTGTGLASEARRGTEEVVGLSEENQRIMTERWERGGVSKQDLRDIGVDLRDGLTASESERVDFLMDSGSEWSREERKEIAIQAFESNSSVDEAVSSYGGQNQAEADQSSKETVSNDKKSLALSSLESLGVRADDLERIGLSSADDFGDEEINKVNYLLSHNYNIDKAVSVLALSEELDVEAALVEEYYQQLTAFEGESEKQQGYLEFLRGGDKTEAFAKLFGLSINSDQVAIKDGNWIIKNPEKGFDLVVTGSGGEYKFGIDGPLGKWNWGADGRTWFFNPSAELNGENVKKAMNELEKMSQSYNS